MLVARRVTLAKRPVDERFPGPGFTGMVSVEKPTSGSAG
jgi:hypothetical protein